MVGWLANVGYKSRGAGLIPEACRPRNAACNERDAMKPIVEKLLELQTILLTKPAEGTEAAAKAFELRREVPSSLLGHFQRRIARGRRAVAVVRNGVCGECHMRLPTGTAASLVSAADVVLCETCGCYLMLAADELETRRREVSEAKERRLKKIRQAASALV